MNFCMMRFYNIQRMKARRTHLVYVLMLFISLLNMHAQVYARFHPVGQNAFIHKILTCETFDFENDKIVKANDYARVDQILDTAGYWMLDAG